MPATAIDFSRMFLGAASLEGFEVPSSLSLGGEQRLVINEFVGRYKRQIQTLGAQPRPLQWQGVFLYDSALARARYFDEQRINGLALDFQWGDFHFLVVIREFHYTPDHVYHIPYSITLDIAQDLSPTSAALVPSRDTVLQGITNTMSDLVTFARSLAGIVAIVQAIKSGDANALLGTITSLSTVVLGVGAILPELPVATLQQYALQAAIIQSQARALAATLDQSKTNSPVTEALQIASAAGILVSLLGELYQPAANIVYTSVHDNLFRIASQFYGDPEAWSQIAQANGLKEAQILGATNVKLPTVNGKSPDLTKGTTPGTVYEMGTYEVPPSESVNSGRR